MITVLRHKSNLVGLLVCMLHQPVNTYVQSQLWRNKRLKTTFIRSTSWSRSHMHNLWLKHLRSRTWNLLTVSSNCMFSETKTTFGRWQTLCCSRQLQLLWRMLLLKPTDTNIIWRRSQLKTSYAHLKSGRLAQVSNSLDGQSQKIHN